MLAYGMDIGISISLELSISLTLIKKHAILPRLWIFFRKLMPQSQSRSYVTNFEISLSRLHIFDAWFCSSSSWGASHELDMTSPNRGPSLRQKNRIIPLKLNQTDDILVNISTFHFISGSSSTLPRNLLSGSRDDVNSGHSDSKHSNSSSVYGEGNITLFDSKGQFSNLGCRIII